MSRRSGRRDNHRRRYWQRPVTSREVDAVRAQVLLHMVRCVPLAATALLVRRGDSS